MKKQDYWIYLLPPKIRKHGRPKGLDKSVVGLPRKKGLTGLVAFENLIPEAKEKITLSWFIGEIECLDVLRGKKITKDMVEVIPENVNNACISECMCLASIKKFLTDDAWKIVINIVTRNYFCSVCKLQIDDS